MSQPLSYLSHSRGSFGRGKPGNVMEFENWVFQVWKSSGYRVIFFIFYIFYLIFYLSNVWWQAGLMVDIDTLEWVITYIINSLIIYNKFQMIVIFCQNETWDIQIGYSTMIRYIFEHRWWQILIAEVVFTFHAKVMEFDKQKNALEPCKVSKHQHPFLAALKRWVCVVVWDWLWGSQDVNPGSRHHLTWSILVLLSCHTLLIVYLVLFLSLFMFMGFLFMPNSVNGHWSVEHGSWMCFFLLTSFP